MVQGLLRATDPLRVKHRGGFSLLDLKRYAESIGFESAAYRSVESGDLGDFQPAIVPVNLAGYPHFVVYRGRVGKAVLIADPGYGNRLLTAEDFETAWQEGIVFVVRRRDGRDPPNRLRLQESDLVTSRAASVRNLISR